MNETKALIIDDEPDIVELLSITLGRMGILARGALSIEEAKNILRQDKFDICLTDLRLPDGDGIELVSFIQQHIDNLPVAVITAHGNMETAVQALKAGAFDFVSKPIDLEKLRHLIRSALKVSESTPEKQQGKKADLLLGESPQIAQLRERVNKLATSQAPVYISGESGSGKELVARLIHQQGPRHKGPFIPVNCGAIPSELMESEFFGHKKGAFTGAVSDKAGLFQAAHEGTLFLDEVADLPMSMQVKLLRAIQEKAVRPVGGQKEVAVNVRLLSATHKNLETLVERGEFRQDLYYRINVIQLNVPPLRDRGNDIKILTDAILIKLAKQNSIPQPQLSERATEALQGYSFPGNIRELENILERAITLCEGNTIDVQDLALPSDVQGNAAMHSASSPSTPSAVATPVAQKAPMNSANAFNNYVDDVEKNMIVSALEENRWNRTAAAKQLGMTLRALRYRIQKYQIE
ncbi:MAG: sigma-54-dependent Fis family transcriptional regulator [Kangiellaceae bacterium]|nr:sigma-54-dependent Fis family transcriptional regulator [Kangiellaceae bacterium]